MYPKRFIYRNGVLIPKKIDNSVQSYNILKNKEIINKSRNSDLNYLNNNFSSKSQNDKKILYDNNKIIVETNKNNTNIASNTICGKNSFLDIKKCKRFKKRPKNFSLYSQIEHICNHIYLSPSKKDKQNIFIEMYEKENDYVKKLNENCLIKDAIMKKKYYSRNFPRLIKYSSSVKHHSFNQNRIKYKATNKINKTNKEELILKQDDEEKNISLEINNKQKSKNNEEINSYIYKNPQLYRLKSDKKIKLPKIKKEQNKQIDFENLIPVKKGIKKDEKINEYMFFKVMKQNRLKKFHI